MNDIVKLIRYRYPLPQKIPNDCRANVEGYCVGGAICLFSGKPTSYRWRFPSVHDLKDILREINPKLLDYEAYDLARFMIGANDDSEFEEAWDIAKEALTKGN